jgi:ATP diphosphatase
MPKQPPLNSPYSLADLMQVMGNLRDPNGGCPWDLAQDFDSIAPYTIEEAYEVADAITRKDFKDLKEELGDLLLQAVYHSQMAAEAGHFTLNDVIHDVTQKMITRHPHVFGDQNAETPGDVNHIWAAQKDKEKSQGSLMDGVAKNLPALLRAEKLQKRAAKIGFEWKKPEQVLAKLEEELNELRSAITNNNTENQAEEIGDALFVIANLARVLGHNPEECARQANIKFEQRFRGIEDDFKEEARDLKNASIEELTTSWDRQKTKSSL